jgi:hypothetical protein
MYEIKHHLVLIPILVSLLLCMSGCIQQETDQSQNTISLIYDTFNENECQHTNSTNFTLEASTNITNITLWYHWSTYETEIPYSILQNNTIIIYGTMVREHCDPIESAWCNAITQLNQTFQSGTYQLRVPNKQIGMNSKSNYNGFIKIYGI